MAKAKPTEPPITLAEHLANVRNVWTPEQARAATLKARLRRSVTQLRPGRWPTDTLLTTEQVCSILGVRPPSLSKLLTSGTIPSTFHSRRYWVRRDDLRAYVNDLLARAEAMGIETARTRV